MKILMVCMGNICRSPLAEAILKQKIADNHIRAEVGSAGTIRFHEGEGADSRAVLTAKKHNLSLADHRAKGIRPSDLDYYDKIFVMDKENHKTLLTIAKGRNLNHKIDFLMNQVHKGKNLEVPDPYYGGANGFEEVYKMLEEACEAIIIQLKEGKEL